MHPHYLAEEFLKDMDLKSCGFVLDSAVFVEALPNQPVRESQWVNQMDVPWLKGIVSYAYLPSDDIEEILKGHSQCLKVIILYLLSRFAIKEYDLFSATICSD
jgi:hypothetical protein